MKIVYFAPSGFDYSSNQMTEGLHLLSKYGKIKFMCTQKFVHHGSKIEDLTLVDESEAYDSARSDADIILISSGGDLDFYSGYRKMILDDPLMKHKIVFLDGHDSNQYLIDPDRVALYLKRELRYPEANSLAWSNVRSLLFGVYDFHFDYKRPGFFDRDIDISFVAFGGSNKIRFECAEAIRHGVDIGKFKNCRVEVESDKQPVSIDAYHAIMLRSKVIVSVPGAGYDTLRFWEAMGFGSVLASIDVSRVMVVRNAPEPNRHAILFDSWSSMLELVHNVVNDHATWQRIRNSADYLVKCNHSTTHRAVQMIQMFKEISCQEIS